MPHSHLTSLRQGRCLRVYENSGIGVRIRPERVYGNLRITHSPGAAPQVRTIHSVKGESHAATLLVAVDSQQLGANWEGWLGGGDPEEVRVAYVALTRAERYSALALPDACPSEVVDEFVTRGFVVPEAD